MSQWNDQNRIGIEVDVPDYVVTEDELSAQSYATQTYVVNYVDEHGGSGGSIDLSSYVSYSYLESKHYLDSVPNDYPTYAAISDMGYITASDVPTPDLSAYVSKNELSEQAYISYVINRDIRPDATGRWNFGSVDYVWDSTYQRNNYLGTKARIYGTNSYEIWVGFGTGTYYYVNRTRIQPNGTTQADLGSSNNNWQNTYTKKLYLNNTDIETRLSAYVTKADLSSQSYVTTTALNNASYASQTYVADYVAEHGSSVDLSSYVSKTELSAQGYITSIPAEYITENELSACGYITIDDVPSTDLSTYVSKTELSAQGYLTSIPSEYITENELSACGYITSGDVPVIDESIIPNTTNTYTLGSHNNYYAGAYTNTIGGLTGLWVKVNNNNRFYFGNSSFRHSNNNYSNCGSSDYRWKATYTYNLYADISYMSNLYLNEEDINDKFISTEGGTITGRLESTYYTTLNYLGGISSYSSVLVGGDDRNSVTMLATRRLCGGTSYAAAFFTNSDGRSKFTHKTKTTATTALGSNDDAFLCFNAYGFKLAYSGTPGTAASTEYELLHTGNIGNLGYATTTDLSNYLSLTGGTMSGDIDMNGSKKGIVTSGGGQWKNGFSYAPLRVTSTATANGAQWTPAIGIKDWGGNTWSIGTVNTRELVFSYQSVGNVDINNNHVAWTFNSYGDLTATGLPTANRTFIHSANYNNYNTSYTYNLADKVNTIESNYVSKAMFVFDSSTNTLTITTT